MSVLFLPPSAGAASVPDATETVSGKIRIATSAEATAGTNDVTAMTPAKTKSVVDAAVVGGVTYQGTFDASAPADLSNATKGDLYIISVAGTYQGQTWAVGDHLLINADMGGTLDPAKIDKVDNTDSVTSVAGRTGAVTLSTADISGLATVASTGAYSDLTGAPTLATVATTGAYSDLSGTPSLATVATTGAYSDLTGTPTLATVATTGAYSDLTGTPTLGTAAAEDVGTLAGNVVQLNGSAQLPAVDGSLLTGITASVAALDNIGDVTITSAQDYDVLKYDSGTSDWVNAPQLNYIYTSTTQSLTAKPGINRVNIDGGASSISLIVQIPTAVAARGVILHVINTGSVANDLLIGADTWTIQPNEGGTWQAQGTNKAYKIADLTPTLGTAAAEDVGTAAGNVVQLNGSAQLPAVDGSLLTGITASVAALNDIGDVSAAAPSNTNVIKYNSTSGDWESGAVAYSEVTGTPTLGTAAALDVGTSATNVVQLNGSAQLPAVDGSLLTGITATVAALNDIGDVSAAAPNNGDVIAYNSTTGDWEATAQSGGGGGSAPSVTVSSPSADQTLTSPSGIEEVYIYTPSTAITVNLVAAATCGSGFMYQIKNRSTNTLTIDPNGAETIDGSATFALSDQEASVTLVTDGSNWFVI